MKRPSAPWLNTTLKSHRELDIAVAEITRVQLPLVEDHPKNWDTVAIVAKILSEVGTSGHILDAGAETYSRILPWLKLYGYRNLEGCNLTFEGSELVDGIRYTHADITRTHYPDAAFDAVTCLSVIEHGVSLKDYFAEMFRILKPGGLLLTSTDYWDTAVDCRGQVMYGVPIHIFSRAEIVEAIDMAHAYGFQSMSELNLDCEDKVVRWQPFGLEYTFLSFGLIKPRKSGIRGYLASVISRAKNYLWRS